MAALSGDNAFTHNNSKTSTNMKNKIKDLIVNTVQLEDGLLEARAKAQKQGKANYNNGKILNLVRARYYLAAALKEIEKYEH